LVLLLLVNFAEKELKDLQRSNSLILTHVGLNQLRINTFLEKKNLEWTQNGGD